MVACELGLLLFLFFALSVESGEGIPLRVGIKDLRGKEERTMKWQCTREETLHTEVHVSLCPNDAVHLKIDNICLHLCRQDLVHLARALGEAAERLSAPGGGQDRDLMQ